MIHKWRKILSARDDIPVSYNSLSGGGGGGGGRIFLISGFYHSEKMYWVTLNVSKNF